MHQVKLKAPQPQPPLKEAATDSIFQAFEYLKRIEAIIQQNAKSTEEALVINLNRFFVQEFEDIKPMKLSETVQKAKEHWKQGTSDGNAQHHLFPKLQIAKLAEVLYNTSLDPKSSQELFEVLAIPPEKKGNLSLFTKHLMCLGFNLREGPAPEDRTADPGHKPDFVPCIHGKVLDIKSKLNFLGWLALFYELQNKSATGSKDIVKSPEYDYHEINDEYGSLLVLLKIPKLPFSESTLQFAAQMFGACNLIHKKEYSSTLKSEPGRFPSPEEFPKIFNEQPEPTTFGSPERGSSKVERSPYTVKGKKKHEQYKFAVSRLKQTLEKTNTLLQEIKQDTKEVAFSLPSLFDHSLFNPEDEEETSKENKINELKKKLLTSIKDPILIIIEAEYIEKLPIGNSKTLPVFLTQYPEFKTEILTAIKSSTSLSQTIKGKVCKDLENCITGGRGVASETR